MARMSMTRISRPLWSAATRAHRLARSMEGASFAVALRLTVAVINGPPSEVGTHRGGRGDSFLKAESSRLLAFASRRGTVPRPARQRMNESGPAGSRRAGDGGIASYFYDRR